MDDKILQYMKERVSKGDELQHDMRSTRIVKELSQAILDGNAYFTSSTIYVYSSLHIEGKDFSHYQDLIEKLYNDEVDIKEDKLLQGAIAKAINEYAEDRLKGLQVEFDNL